MQGAIQLAPPSFWAVFLLFLTALPAIVVIAYLMAALFVYPKRAVVAKKRVRKSKSRKRKKK